MDILGHRYSCTPNVLRGFFSTLHRDEDMQSLASLMSMKQTDIGNLDDFNESDDEVGEERRTSFGTGHAAHVTGKTRDTLRDHWVVTNNDSLNDRQKNDRLNKPNLRFSMKAMTGRLYCRFCGNRYLVDKMGNCPGPMTLSGT